jgi:tellurite resistance protein
MVTKLVNQQSRLANMPVSFFSIVMGWTGFAIALQKVVDQGVVGYWLTTAALVVSSIFFGLLLIGYITKIVIYPQSFKKEFKDPVKINFIPTISISFLLQSIAYLSINKQLSMWLWFFGVVLQFILSVLIIGSWVWRQTITVVHFSPAWFIPAVGNMLIPVAGVSYMHEDISWFFFSIGVLFWLILMVVFFYRIFFHPAISAKLLPTFFILIAPPSVITISLFKLTGELSIAAKMSYFISLFIFILLLVHIKMFVSSNFYLSWWAYSFPLSALTIASSVMYHSTLYPIYFVVAVFMLIMTMFLVTLLSYKTTQAILRKNICNQE